MDVHPVTSLWQENLVTWSTQPTLDPTPAGTIPPQPRNRVWVTVDITALVQSWTCGLTTDFGIALLGNSNRRSEYASREWPSASERPELVVDYTPGAGCGHFSIGHDGSGDICTVESVTLTRHDAIHGVDIGYAGTASLSTSTGDGTWTLIAGAGTLIDSGGGNATYVFDPADTGQVELGLQASTAGAVDIDVTDGTSAEDPSEDPVLTFVDASSGTFRDEFNAVAYSGSDGTLAWSTDWLEINEGDGPNAGDERVITDLGGLRLRVRDNDGGGEGVEREADLSAFTSATLNFDYRRNLLLRSVDYVTVEVSLDGGANWTELDRFAGPASDTSYSSASYDISAYIAADTRIRFLSSSSMLFFSSVLFDDVEIDASGAGGCSAIDHIVISIGAGAASTCSPHAVTITVEDSSNNPVIDYAGTVTLRTSSLHGDWTVNDANGVLDNATADDGDATYAFVTSDAGDVVLDLANGHADDLTVTVEDAAASVSTTSAVLGFRDDAFVVSPSDPLGAEVVAGRDHRFQAELWRKDPSSGLCAVETGYAGSFDLKAWYTPDASDPGGAPPAIASPLPTTPPAGNNWTASFTAGVASFDLVTTDVGKYVLNLRDDSSGFAVDTGGNPIAIDGSSQTLTTRPFGLSLGGVMAGATVNPANDTSSGLIFTSAGSDFEAVVTAMGWAAADDADDDGVPDVGANLADNTPTASFAWTTSLSAGAPYQPATGVLGGLANATPRGRRLCRWPGDRRCPAVRRGRQLHPRGGCERLPRNWRRRRDRRECGGGALRAVRLPGRAQCAGVAGRVRCGRIHLCGPAVRVRGGAGCRAERPQ